MASILLRRLLNQPTISIRNMMKFKLKNDKLLRVLYCTGPSDESKYKNISIKMVQKLEKLFDIKAFRVLDVLDNNCKLQNVPYNKIQENFEICQSYNVDKDVILHYAEVLTNEDLSNKLKLLQELPFPISTTFVLANIKTTHLKRLVFRIQEEIESGIPGGRILHLSKLLKCEPEFVCEEYVKKPFLHSKDMAIIEADVKLLLSFGIPLEDIKRDLWVLRYSTDHLQERLNFAKENNVEHIKTWMMRATTEIFETYLRRKSDNRDVLGDSSLIEYLSNRLECDIDFAKSLILRQPALKNKSMKKLQQMIDFLFGQGFTPGHICRVPKILLHSVNTSTKRLKELEEQGVKMGSLHILTKSQKQYRHYYETLTKINKKS